MDDKERWEYVERRLIELSGELMATRLIASISLDWLVAGIPDNDRRIAQVKKLGELVDKSLEGMRQIGGDKEANERTVEIARVRADEILAKIASMRTKQ